MLPNGRQQDRAYDLVVVGEVNPDVVVADPDPHPVFGQAERIVGAINLTVGSSSVITACGAARLGLRVAMVGVVGDDAFGRFMLDSMRARELDVSAVRRLDGRPTGASVILSDGQDRAILTARGTIGTVTAADVPTTMLADARHLHIGSWFLQDGLRPDAGALLARARAAGVTTSLDPNWDPSGRWDGGLMDVLSRLDLVFPNDAEVRRIVGLEDVDAAAVELARRGRTTRPDDAGQTTGPWVVVKCGVDGALLASAEGIVARVAGYPVDSIDTTGAGDSFDAGFLSAWLTGSSPEDALRVGAVAGALSTRAMGGVDGQPTREDVAAALQAWAP